MYLAAGSLRAVTFDAEELEVKGNPVPLPEEVTSKLSGAALFDVSRQGSLLFVDGGNAVAPVHHLVWVDRQGREEPVDIGGANYGAPRIFPDGRSAVMQINASGGIDIWVTELGRNTLSRVTTDGSRNMNPIWASDGHEIVFASNRNESTFGSSLSWQMAPARLDHSG